MLTSFLLSARLTWCANVKCITRHYAISASGGAEFASCSLVDERGGRPRKAVLGHNCECRICRCADDAPSTEEGREIPQVYFGRSLRETVASYRLSHIRHILIFRSAFDDHVLRQKHPTKRWRTH